MINKEVFSRSRLRLPKIQADRLCGWPGQQGPDEMKYQLTVKGGADMCLHFPSYDRHYAIELKFATLFYSPETLQVWGTRKLAREFHKRLFKLTDAPNHEAFCSVVIQQDYGDMSQTMGAVCCWYLNAKVGLFGCLASLLARELGLGSTFRCERNCSQQQWLTRTLQQCNIIF
jgi:hypothetical protein